MELCREPRIFLVFDSFVRTIIHIDEQRFPICPQRIIVYRITMILRSNKTTFRTHHAYRLVVATVSIFKFVNLCPSGFREQLVAHADSKDGKFLVRHCLADILHSCVAGIRVTRAVGDKQPVKFESVKIIIPRYTDHFYTTLQQATDNIGFYTTIHQNNFFKLRIES